MSLSSLEAERQSILDRMKMRREAYRRMLVDGTDLDAVPVERIPHARSPSQLEVYRPEPVPTHVVRNGGLMRTLNDHPFLCALGVAAIVAIGPRRIMRGITNGAASVGATAMRNPSSVDMVGRLLAMVGSYVQSRNEFPPHR